jgi:asparagine synthase (glutamine-hydrolysing)
MYFVSERARRDVKVALIGQGPDELFGGYKRHVGVRYGEYWRRLPAWIRGPLGHSLARLPRNETLKRGVASLTIPDRLRRYQHVFSLLPGPSIDGLFRPELLPLSAGDAVLQCWAELVPYMEQTDELGGFQFLEIRSSLPDELLMYADKLSMAHGLEVRVPYLDRTIVEYVQRLGSEYKIRGGRQKWLHRQVCRHYLPRTILRRKKRGFAVNVVDEWFSSALSAKLTDVLLDPQSSIFAFLSPARVRTLLLDHQAGRQDNHKVLFSLVLLEEWLRMSKTNTMRQVAFR